MELKTFHMQARYAQNSRFLDVVAPDAKTAKKLIRERTDHHTPLLGVSVVYSTGSKK